jgi:hypothetical protein
LATVPVGHAVHAAAAVSLNVSPAHVWQNCAPLAAANVPAAQSVHGAFPVGLKVPGVHVAVVATHAE